MTALLAILVVLSPGSYAGDLFAQAAGYLQTFDGSPAAPLFWRPVDWDVTILGHDMNSIEPMQADHGADCSAPPNTHLITQIEQTVFICRDHVMTAMNNGYGAIYLTPNQLLDFSQGAAVLKWDMSTARNSSRDWVDIVVMPYAENLQINFQDVHFPPNAVHLELAGGNGVFSPTIYRNGVEERVSADTFHTWDMIFANFGLTASAVRRDTFELTLSRTHMRFRMPAYNVTWIDTDIAPLTWSQGVVQLNQRSYNPNKACDFDGTCGPNTWHWDNVSVSPAAQFTLLRGDRRFVDATTPATVTFPAAAPNNASLRFAGVGKPIDFSVDGGRTWVTAHVQPPESPATNASMGDNFWSPIPAGTRSVMLRGTRQGTVMWGVQDISIWAPGPQVIIPTQTPVVQQPGPTLTPTPSNVPGAPTSTPTPTPVASGNNRSQATATPTAIPPAPPTSTTSGGPGNGGSRPPSGGNLPSEPPQYGEGGGGGGPGFLAFPPSPPAAQLIASPVTARAPAAPGMGLPAQGGELVIDSLNLVLGVPGEALNGRAVTVSAQRLDRASLPPAMAGFRLGSDAFDLKLNTDDGSQLNEFVAPIQLRFQLSAADFGLLGGGNQIDLALWSGTGWTPLPCSLADGARLVCETSHFSMFAVLVASGENQPLEGDLANGHFYSQTNGFSGAGGTGFAVVDDAEANMWSEFQRLGGTEALGYPVSGRFVYRGFMTQAFQKLALQWRPDTEEALPVNVLDELSQRGTDVWLERTRQVPLGDSAVEDLGLPWDDVVSRHLALLDAYPALHEVYLNDPQALNSYGLPLAVKDYGTFISVRLQRATLQLWLVDRPWAAAGSVVVGNAGDLAKEAGLWPLNALAPEPRPLAIEAPLGQ
ncbi:MAG TPA: hypothetical protein VGL99_31485 [Chloroflexota bacterium]